MATLPPSFNKGLTPNKGPVAAINNAKTKGRQLAFPDNLATIDHWVAFTAHEHKAFRKNRPPQKDTLQYIYLPIPANLGTAYAADYSAAELGVVGRWASDNVNKKTIGEFASAMGDAATGKGTAGLTSMGKKISDSIKLAAKDGSLTGGGLNMLNQFADNNVAAIGGLLAAGPLGGIVGLAAEQTLKGALFGNGIARNPHMAVLYAGTGFRTHQFQYKLMPNNKEESESIRQIIKAFKWYMAPQYSMANHFFNYPQQFDIDFNYSDHLFNIAPSVLTAFDVNYHGEGIPAYHAQTNVFDSSIVAGAVPMSVIISMTFQEVTITTKAEIEKDNR